MDSDLWFASHVSNEDILKSDVQLMTDVKTDTQTTRPGPRTMGGDLLSAPPNVRIYNIEIDTHH